MKLIEDLISSVRLNSAPAKDVRVGVSWTGVWGKHCGLAKTYGIPVTHGNYTRDMGRLTEKTTLELAEYSKSWNLVEASIGVAAINSMIKCENAVDANVQELILKEARGKKVAVTGYFPFIPELKKLAGQLWVFELEPWLLNPAEGVIVDTAAETVIPESEMVILTGSALINKSLQRLLELCRSAKAYTAVLGPSTPLSEVLLRYGADLVAGVEVVKPEPVLKKLSQSGGMLDSKVCPGEIAFKLLMR